jgi:DNA replication protein DnaC
MLAKPSSHKFFRPPSWNHDWNTCTERLALNGFGELYRNATWDKVEGGEKIYHALRKEFLADEHKPRGLFVSGNIGVGKTCLLALCARFLIQNWNAVTHYIPAGALFDLYFEKNTGVVNALMQSEFLFIDDIGRAYSADFPVSKFETFIEHRYANLLPTFISSDMSLDDLRKKNGFERIGDRINDSKWMMHVTLSGKSKRKR